MAYNKQATSIREKLQLDECFRDKIFEELKQNIEKVVKTNNNPIPKRYIEFAIAEFQNEIGGSNPTIYDNDKIEDVKLYKDIRNAIQRCINNLINSGKKPTQDELRSAVEKLSPHLFNQ
jgi:hypothetical protein